MHESERMHQEQVQVLQHINQRHQLPNDIAKSHMVGRVDRWPESSQTCLEDCDRWTLASPHHTNHTGMPASNDDTGGGCSAGRRAGSATLASRGAGIPPESGCTWSPHPLCAFALNLLFKTVHQLCLPSVGQCYQGSHTQTCLDCHANRKRRSSSVRRPRASASRPTVPSNTSIFFSCKGPRHSVTKSPYDREQCCPETMR